MTIRTLTRSPCYTGMLDPGWPTQVTLKRICKLVFKLELSESISKLSGTQHASSEVLLNKNIIQYEDEALMAERQRLKTDDSERVITESAPLIT